MKQLSISLLMAVLLIVGLPFSATANKTTTKLKVSELTTITEDIDFVISGSTPFDENGVVDIVNTEHAVVIIEKIKPSAALKLLSHVKINGQEAVNGTNCQVKLYNRGTIIMPYDKDFKPLTVFSEQNYGGESVNSFGLENSGGFMVTLSAAKLNNRIRSFKLKRGYMVTFSTLPNGRGYSRCFIAADKDLEVSSLPVILDKKISSYRVFQWYDTGKAGLANDTRSEAVSKLNVTSCYAFSLGENRLPDAECVPHHIYEDWPSAAACGGVTYSPHLKTNNEPGNSADDHPQSVEEILNNWENLMATGMRLCSPSSHDGSLNHLRTFMEAVDERGWRCDILDLHCYWNEWNLNHNVEGWYNTYKRPIWISEWVWGSSWNNEGIFKEASSRDNPTDADLQKNKTVIQGVCQTWNSAKYIERYYYWNSEANCSKIYRDGALTPAGQYYASINSGLAYTNATNYIPTTPKQKAASKVSVDYDKAAHKAVISWYDSNGEYNNEMVLERSMDGGTTWTAIKTIDQKEAPSNYSYSDTEVYDGVSYRVRIVDLNGKTQYSDVVKTLIANVELGDAITVDGQPMYVGGNMLGNGDFNLGLTDWTSGTGDPLDKPYFQAVPVAGIDGGSYLQCYGSTDANGVASLKKLVPVKPNTNYMFRFASRNGGGYQRINVSADAASEGTEVLKFDNTTDWQTRYASFNSGTGNYAVITFRWLGAKAQFDKMELCQLFATRDEALADGVAKLRQRAQTVMDYNQAPELAALNSELQQRIDAITTADALSDGETAIAQLLQALKDREAIDSLTAVIAGLTASGVELPSALNMAWAVAPEYYTADYFTSHRKSMQEALDAFLTYTDAKVQPQAASFSSTTGWETKVGTFTGGDQRTNTVGGKSCWNAWWSQVSASEGENKTLEVRQTVNNLPQGIYALECKATTEHYCLSDQHGYLTVGDDTRNTPALASDYFDLPGIGNIWQTLTTAPVFVAEGASVTIGFKSSKQGAVDNAWRQVGNDKSTGDKREGWWCATDFRLLFHPAFKITATPGQWGTICLAYASTIPEGVKCYRIAGILKDQTQICLEELPTLAAGQPAIYQSELAEPLFWESGDPVESALPSTGENNLQGYLKNSRSMSGYYGLTDGTWTELNRGTTLEANTACLKKIDDLPMFDSWAGATIPIIVSGSTAIQGVATDHQPTSRYTIDGRRSTRSRGIVIESNGKSSRKILK